MSFLNDCLAVLRHPDTIRGLSLGFGVVLFGVALAYAAPLSDVQRDMTGGWGRFSAALGWTYFAAWSISFYPQVLMNWRRHSVVGLSLDYQLYNIIGFVSYAIFNCTFFFSPNIQMQYNSTHGGGGSSLVQVNDVFFACHAVLLTSFTIFQCLIYDRGGQTLSRPCLAISAFMVVTAAVYGLLTAAHVENGSTFFMTISWLYYLSYIKMVISLIKYVPQVLMNMQRRSTVGWNIWNIYLDITGGILSVLQLFVDAWQSGHIGGVFGDPAKLGLGLLSIFFDIIFLVRWSTLLLHLLHLLLLHLLLLVSKLL